MSWFATATIASAIAFIVFSIVKKRHQSRLPPGPKGVPFLGNIYDVPAKEQWLTYARWSKEYDSDIVYMNLAGTHVVILNSAEHIAEVLDKRSAISSNRSPFIMINELMGWNFTFAFQHYGDEWRERRRLFHHHFSPQAIAKYRPLSTRETVALLTRLLDHPDDFTEHLRLMAGTIILTVTYGIKILPKGDPHIAAADKALEGLQCAGTPGSFLVDSIPALKYVPTWFPGASFKRKAAVWNNATLRMIEGPFRAAKRAIADGSAPVSVVSSLLSEASLESHPKREELIRNVAGAAYAAGADTSVSVLGTFIMAVMIYPEVQRKAQAELDRVIGKDRLPTHDDEPDLPYITAIYREAVRWRPVTPLAVPHRLTRDDEYMGYHLPAGTVVLGNAWAVLHDERHYPDPDTFNPDRFLTKDGKLDPNVTDPAEFAFGYGRRICPGRYLAASSIWLAMACILSTFELDMPVDEHGQKIRPSGRYTEGLAVYPEPYKCVFKPKSAHAESVIRAAASELDP